MRLNATVTVACIASQQTDWEFDSTSDVPGLWHKVVRQLPHHKTAVSDRQFCISLALTLNWALRVRELLPTLWS